MINSEMILDRINCIYWENEFNPQRYLRQKIAMQLYNKMNYPMIPNMQSFTLKEIWNLVNKYFNK